MCTFEAQVHSFFVFFKVVHLAGAPFLKYLRGDVHIFNGSAVYIFELIHPVNA